MAQRGLAQQDPKTAPQAEDVRLMQLVAEGDPRARRLLANRLVDRARRVALHILGDPHEADDAAQQALLTILRSAASYQGHGSLERWASRIMVRGCLRYARRVRARGEVDDEAVTLSTKAEPVDADALRERVPRPVVEYLGELPESQRHALVLRYGLDLSIAEIAEEVGIKEATVRYRLGAGLRRMRASIRRDARFGGTNATGGEP